jgi:hypothetical protein
MITKYLNGGVQDLQGMATEQKQTQKVLEAEICKKLAINKSNLYTQIEKLTKAQEMKKI